VTLDDGGRVFHAPFACGEHAGRQWIEIEPWVCRDLDARAASLAQRGAHGFRQWIWRGRRERLVVGVRRVRDRQQARREEWLEDRRWI
jgi:hypothetical protein